jgi:hypothetical protein
MAQFTVTEVPPPPPPPPEKLYILTMTESEAQYLRTVLGNSSVLPTVGYALYQALWERVRRDETCKQRIENYGER